MQDETFHKEIYFCQQCYTETEAYNPECPQCGIKMKTRSQMQSLGIVFVLLGVVLTSILGLCDLLFIGILIFGKLSSEKFPAFLIAVIALSAGTAAGVAIIVGGVWQKKHGRQSRIAIQIFQALIGLMFLIGGILQVFYG